MTRTRNPQPPTATRPNPEQLRRSPEANATRSHAKGVPQPPHDDNKARYEAIQQAAYQRAEKRGFEPGHEMDDWLEAEREYEQLRSESTEKH